MLDLLARAFSSCELTMDLGTACISCGMARRSSCCSAQETSGLRMRTSDVHNAWFGNSRSSVVPTRTRKRDRTTRFDAARYLKTEKEAAAYLKACMDEADGDAALIAAALGDIARAYGMSKLAREVGMSRV